MKLRMRWFVILLVVALLAPIPVPASATTIGNVSLFTEQTKQAVGDTFSVQIKSNQMSVCSFTCGVKFDNTKLKVLAILGKNNTDVVSLTTDDSVDWTALAISTLDEANASGSMGVAFANSKERKYKADTVVTILFEALKESDTTVILYEDSDGTDGNRSEQVQSLTFQINKSEAPNSYALKKSVVTENSATIEVTNCTDAETKGVLILATYDEKGRMLFAEKNDCVVNAQGTVTATIDYVGNDSVHTIRAFFLEENTFVPLCPKLEFTLAE